MIGRGIRATAFATVAVAAGVGWVGGRATAGGVDGATDDARRAAATRLLAASHFRDRQRVVLPEGIRAAQVDLAEECVVRAADGRDIASCGGALRSSAAVRARVAARQSDMLDEIVSASETAYAREFTAAEMDEITRFFRSPTGQKYAVRYPAVIDQVGVARRPILRRYLLAAANPGFPRP